MCPFNARFADPATEPGYGARGPGERPTGVEALPGESGSRSAQTGSDHFAASGSQSTDSAESPGRTDGNMGPFLARRPKHPGTNGPPLTKLLRTALSEEAWEAFSRGSAIRRAGRAGFARNVCVAMGNGLAGEKELPAEAVRVLVEALSDPAPLVRGHAAWALGCVGSADVTGILSAALEDESDDLVRGELELALERCLPSLK